MKSLDLKGFKKVASDEHTTTLRHVYGHELKVAHRALSSKLRQELDSLPGHKPKKMAEGGMADYETGTTTGQDEYVPPAPEAPPVQFDAQAMMRDPDTGETPDQQFGQGQSYNERPPNAPPEAPSAEPPAEQPEPTPAPATAAPTAPTSNPYAQLGGASAAFGGRGGGSARPPAEPPPQAPPQFTPQQTADYIKTQTAAFQQDMDTGHIKPETFESLFAKKDTLGKIGTLFGLLVSGAGSGLSHQPNAVLAMIQKEIDNDFEAQKQSSTNKQNFLKLNQEHQMQMATMHQMDFQNQVHQAQVGNIASEVEARKHTNALTDAQAREAGMRAQAIAKTQANSAVVHSLVLSLGKLPPGSPEYAQAQQQLAMLSQGIQNENYNIADRAAASIALSNLTLGSGNVANNDAAFEQQQQILTMTGQKERADENRKRYIPGVGMATVEPTAQDREAIRANQDMLVAVKDYRDFVAANAGTVFDQAKVTEGKIKAKELQSAYRIARKFGTPTGSEQEFIEGIIPTDPTQFFADTRTLPKINAVMQRTQQNLDGHLKSLGIAPRQQAAPPPPPVGTIEINQHKQRRIRTSTGWKAHK